MGVLEYCYCVGPFGLCFNLQKESNTHKLVCYQKENPNIISEISCGHSQYTLTTKALYCKTLTFSIYFISHLAGSRHV